MLIDEKVLVFGDLHIGSDSNLAASGALSPLIGLTEIRETMQDIFVYCKSLEKIILLGDLANNFGNPSFTEVREIRKLLDWLKSRAELIVIKGNHDRFIEKILLDLEVEFLESYQYEDYFFTHGDKIVDIHPGLDVKILVIGHEHPGIKISNGIRTEKFKCVLESIYEGMKLIVLPSVNQLSIGTDLLNYELLSPYLTEEVLENAHVYVVSELEVLDFGRLRDLE